MKLLNVTTSQLQNCAKENLAWRDGEAAHRQIFQKVLIGPLAGKARSSSTTRAAP